VSKVIAITGAGAGLGRALARRFLADGEQVVLLGRTLSKVEAVAREAGAGAMALECDIASPAAVRAAFAEIAARHSKLDVLINNAVFYEPFLIEQASDEQVGRTFGSNLVGPVLCARAAIPLMGKGAHILNVSSESVGMNFPHLVAYQASKAGLERFSQGLQHELEPRGIKVTLVRAGSMYEEGKTWDVDPEAKMRFAQAAMAAGIDLRKRPLSHYRSITDVFRAVIDLPADVQVVALSLQARSAE